MHPSIFIDRNRVVIMLSAMRNVLSMQLVHPIRVVRVVSAMRITVDVRFAHDNFCCRGIVRRINEIPHYSALADVRVMNESVVRKYFLAKRVRILRPRCRRRRRQNNAVICESEQMIRILPPSRDRFFARNSTAYF